MRSIAGLACFALLSLPALAEGAAAGAKDGVKVDDKSAAVKDGKDAVKADDKGVSAKSGDKAAAVTTSGVVLDKGGAHDCALNAEPTLSGKKLTFVITGKCTKVTIAGKENTVTLEHSTTVDVSGDKNKVFAKETEAVNVSGKHNEVVWSGTGKAELAEPAVKNTGKENTVKKGDQAVVDAGKVVVDDKAKKADADSKKEGKKAQKEVDNALKGLGSK